MNVSINVNVYTIQACCVISIVVFNIRTECVTTTTYHHICSEDPKDIVEEKADEENASNLVAAN